MQISCPNCGQKYDVDDSCAGQTAQCEQCGEKFVVYAVVKPPKPTQPAIPKTRTCPMCGENILIIAKKCRYCGTMLTRQSRQYDRSAFVILGLLFGGLGVHNFYVGRFGAAFLNLSLFILTFVSCGIAAAINMIFVIANICADPNDDIVRKKWKQKDGFYRWLAVCNVFLFIGILLLIIYENIH